MSIYKWADAYLEVQGDSLHDAFSRKYIFIKLSIAGQKAWQNWLIFVKEPMNWLPWWHNILDVFEIEHAMPDISTIIMI